MGYTLFLLAAGAVLGFVCAVALVAGALYIRRWWRMDGYVTTSLPFVVAGMMLAIVLLSGGVLVAVAIELLRRAFAS